MLGNLHDFLLLSAVIFQHHVFPNIHSGILGVRQLRINQFVSTSMMNFYQLLRSKPDMISA